MPHNPTKRRRSIQCMENFSSGKPCYHIHKQVEQPVEWGFTIILRGIFREYKSFHLPVFRL